MTIQPPTQPMIQGKWCPFCKSLIPATATVCSHCGRAVTQAPYIAQLVQSIGCLLMIVGIVIIVLVLLPIL